jgi:hypothetical protein
MLLAGGARCLGCGVDVAKPIVLGAELEELIQETKQRVSHPNIDLVRKVALRAGAIGGDDAQDQA